MYELSVATCELVNMTKMQANMADIDVQNL